MGKEWKYNQWGILVEQIFQASGYETSPEESHRLQYIFSVMWLADDIFDNIKDIDEKHHALKNLYNNFLIWETWWKELDEQGKSLPLNNDKKHNFTFLAKKTLEWSITIEETTDIDEFIKARIKESISTALLVMESFDKPISKNIKQEFIIMSIIANFIDTIKDIKEDKEDNKAKITTNIKRYILMAKTLSKHLLWYMKRTNISSKKIKLWRKLLMLSCTRSSVLTNPQKEIK